MDAIYNWDVFISHASEDKDDIVFPLANALKECGVSVWLDSQQLEIGDSLRQKIDEGLSKSRFGIVIMSESFFKKLWTSKELDGLTARERNGFKVILPVWHKVTGEEIAKFSPLLAGILAAQSHQGVNKIAKDIALVVSKEKRTSSYKTANKNEADSENKNHYANFELEFGNAVGFYKSSQFESAFSIFEEVFRQNPDCWPAKLYLGVCKIKLKDYEKAIKIFEESLPFNRKTSLINSYLAETYFYRGELTSNYTYYNKSWNYFQNSGRLSNNSLLEIKVKLNKLLEKGWMSKMSILTAFSHERSDLPPWHQWREFEGAVKANKDTCEVCLTINPQRCYKCGICTVCDYTGREYCFKHSPSDNNTGS
ncbi:MAG: TIR domain-containing protein [Chitinophagaceae bacterium]